MRRLYWAACVALLGTGLAGAVLVVLFPTEHYDEFGRLIGEMPPEFGAALGLAFLGAAGLVSGGLVLGVNRLRRRVRGKRPRR